MATEAAKSVWDRRFEPSRYMRNCSVLIEGGVEEKTKFLVAKVLLLFLMQVKQNEEKGNLHLFKTWSAAHHVIT